MLDSNHIAFKEWAVICAALGQGLQTFIIRKGGIHEGREGFRVAHGEFWMFPTYVHEAAAGLEPEAADLLDRVERERPPAGFLRISEYAVVTDVFEVGELAPLMRLAGQHLWSPQTIGARFAYRQPGLFVVVARMYARATPHTIPDSPHFAGCRTWVELPVRLSTENLVPVLTDEEFDARRASVRRQLSAEFRDVAT